VEAAGGADADREAPQAPTAVPGPGEAIAGAAAASVATEHAGEGSARSPVAPLESPQPPSTEHAAEPPPQPEASAEGEPPTPDVVVGGRTDVEDSGTAVAPVETRDADADNLVHGTDDSQQRRLSTLSHVSSASAATEPVHRSRMSVASVASVGGSAARVEGAAMTVEVAEIAGEAAAGTSAPMAATNVATTGPVATSRVPEHRRSSAPSKTGSGDGVDEHDAPVATAAAASSHRPEGASPPRVPRRAAAERKHSMLLESLSLEQLNAAREVHGRGARRRQRIEPARPRRSGAGEVAGRDGGQAETTEDGGFVSASAATAAAADASSIGGGAEAATGTPMRARGVSRDDSYLDAGAPLLSTRTTRKPAAEAPARAVPDLPMSPTSAADAPLPPPPRIAPGPSVPRPPFPRGRGAGRGRAVAGTGAPFRRSIDPLELRQAERNVFRLAREVFELRQHGWLHRNVISVTRNVARFMLHGQIYRKLREVDLQITSAETAAWLLGWLRDTVWPDGEMPPPEPDPTPAEVLDRRLVTQQELLRLIKPASTLLGNSHSKLGVCKLHEWLQSPLMVRHFFFCLFDLVLSRLFPDMALPGHAGSKLPEAQPRPQRRPHVAAAVAVAGGRAGGAAHAAAAAAAAAAVVPPGATVQDRRAVVAAAAAAAGAARMRSKQQAEEQRKRSSGGGGFSHAMRQIVTLGGALPFGRDRRRSGDGPRRASGADAGGRGATGSPVPASPRTPKRSSRSEAGAPAGSGAEGEVEAGAMTPGRSGSMRKRRAGGSDASRKGGGVAARVILPGSGPSVHMMR